MKAQRGGVGSGIVLFFLRTRRYMGVGGQRHAPNAKAKQSNVKLSLCTPWRHWGSGCAALLILKLDTGWRRVVSFTPQPICPRENSPRYSLSRRFSGLPCRFRRFGQEKNFLPLVGIQPRVLGCLERSFVIVAISQSWPLWLDCEVMCIRMLW